jgi:PAS domain S-box-containing protein
MMKVTDIAAFVAAQDSPVMANLSVVDALNVLPDGLYITDTDRRILFWNKAAEAITGWPAEQVVGRHCRDGVLNHQDQNGLPLCGEEQCPLHRAIVTGQSLAEPLLIYAQHKDGQRIPIEVMVSPLRNAAGTIVGGVELFRDAASFHEDLRAAGLVQRHVLECDLPEGGPLSCKIHHMPAKLIGGDFFRVERLGPNQYAAMVADVMGHGISAALFTMQMRVIWDDLDYMLGYPEAFMSCMNDRLRKFVRRDNYFSTACHVVVDVAAGQVALTSAGHPPPILRRADGRFEELLAGGPALGLIDGASYPESVVRFGPGDGLLLYTDGAIEVMDRGGVELGTAGLIRLCSELRKDGLPELTALEDAILRFGSDVRFQDDVSFVSLAG